MKNSKILVAVMAVMMFSYAKAEEIKVDFDGRNSISINFIEAIAPQISNTDAIEIPAQKFESEMTVDAYKKKLNQSLDNSIISAIEYCKKQDFSILESDFRKLLTYGTLEEKYQSIYEYKIPTRISLMKELVENRMSSQYGLTRMIKETKGANPVCLEWDTQEVCIDKDECDNVCDAGSLVCLAFTKNGACAVWGPACHIVCRIIKDCHQWPVCVRWYTDVY